MFSQCAIEIDYIFMIYVNMKAIDIFRKEFSKF